MSNTIFKLKQLEDIFRNYTCTVLGLNPSDPLNNSRVRIAWPTGGSPGWKITEDVAFIRVCSVNSEYAKQRDTEYAPNSDSDVNIITSYTLPRLVSWTLYGPNSFDDIETIRSGLYGNEYLFGGSSNLRPVIDFPVPVRSPELFDGRWWERSDFSATFYEKVTRQNTIPTIQSVNILIKTEEGVTENANPIT